MLDESHAFLLGGGYTRWRGGRNMLRSDCSSRNHSRRLQAHAIDVGACGDVKTPVVRVAKGHVGGADPGSRFFCLVRQLEPAEKLSFRRGDPNDRRAAPSSGRVEIS